MTAWVPAGAWLAPGYAEWPAPPALSDAVACLWARVVPDDGGTRESVVLPDGCCDLIWERGVGAYVAGPDTAAVPSAWRPGSVFAGVRFRPGHGGPVLGLPLSEIRDQRVGLADVLSAAAGGGIAADIAADRAPADAAVLALDLAGRLVAGRVQDPAVARAALLLRDPSVRAGDIAAEAGLGERQFRRRFHAAAGYGPKTLQRVLRFQRFVRRIDAMGRDAGLAAAAAEAGYADQAHLTRECRALSRMTPAALAGTRGLLPVLRACLLLLLVSVRSPDHHPAGNRELRGGEVAVMRVRMRTGLVFAGISAMAIGGVMGLAGPASAAPASHTAMKGDPGQRAVLITDLAPSVPSDPPVFGAAAGGLPWDIRHGEAVLGSGGFLRVDVAGLVVTTTGKNPLPDLAASVYCDGTLAATTSAVPFSPAGDAHLFAKVMLPAFCPAPAVLINPATGSAPADVKSGIYIAFDGAAGS